MGMAEMEQAVAAIVRTDAGDFVGPRPPSLVASGERVLGVRFPPTYRRFLLEFGAGDVGDLEVYGIIDEPVDEGPVPNGVWLTLRTRQHGLPEDLVIVSDTGYGEAYVLDTATVDEGGENPVVIWDVGYERPYEVVAPDFGSFFWEQVELVLEDQDVEDTSP